MSDETPKLPDHLARGRGRGIFFNRGLLSSPASSVVSPSTSSRGGSTASQQLSLALGTKRGTTRDETRVIYATKPSSCLSKQGDSGRSVQLFANYFRLLKKPEFEFNVYRVDFEPVVDNEAMRKSFLRQHKEKIGGYLYDGGQILFLTHRLENDTVILPCESREGDQYQVYLKKTDRSISDTDMQSMQILNLILKQTMGGLKMELVGRNLYDAKSKVSMPQFKLELWPGYVTSIRQHEDDVLICCDVSHKVMRQDTVYEILKSHMAAGGDWQEAFKRAVIGSVVLTGYNNKTYRIDDVDFNASPSSTFESKDGPKSIVDYYSQRYNLNIKDKSQPLLVSKPKARDIRANRDQILLLVPELCRATGLTDKQRANFTMMREMAQHTQMDPKNRQKRLLELVTRLYSSEESRKKLEGFQTDIDKQLVTFSGRALNQEKMIFGRDQTLQNDDRVDWQAGFRKNSMFHSVPLARWVFMYPPKTDDASEKFLKAMMDVARGMSYEIKSPKMIALTSDRASAYIDSIKEVIQKDPKLIMVVLPNNAADRYAAIKCLTCIDNSIPTQAIVLKTMTPKNGNCMSVATKVVIQINAKLGGAPWMIGSGPLKGVMTIGFDVATDTKNKSVSYGVFVASMDLSETVRYYSTVSKHKNDTEMSANIMNQFEGALFAFRSEHGTLPEKIFFYRDGVSEGQIEFVHSNEVVKLNNKLEQLYRGADKTPKMTFIVVNKRINTRIFSKNEATLDNPVSGTIVDNTITLPERYDFFLISQSVRQGTVGPTSYNVIHDSSGWTADKIQMFTYKQTHLYYNWSGCVRVPAVNQYARKLSVLVSEFLHNVPSTGFNNQLYFL